MESNDLTEYSLERYVLSIYLSINNVLYRVHDRKFNKEQYEYEKMLFMDARRHPDILRRYDSSVTGYKTG